MLRYGECLLFVNLLVICGRIMLNKPKIGLSGGYC